MSSWNSGSGFTEMQMKKITECRSVEEKCKTLKNILNEVLKINEIRYGGRAGTIYYYWKDGKVQTAAFFSGESFKDNSDVVKGHDRSKCSTSIDKTERRNLIELLEKCDKKMKYEAEQRRYWSMVPTQGSKRRW